MMINTHHRMNTIVIIKHKTNYMYWNYAYLHIYCIKLSTLLKFKYTTCLYIINVLLNKIFIIISSLWLRMIGYEFILILNCINLFYTDSFSFRSLFISPIRRSSASLKFVGRFICFVSGKKYAKQADIRLGIPRSNIGSGFQ